jgi:tetratricopeptide (TPR) repeat protein
LAGVVRASDPDEAERLLEGAESDLRRAIDGNPTPAGALRALSELMEDRGRTAEAIVYAQRAWERDPFYDQADVIPRRLYEYFFRLAQDDDAQTWCETGRDRFKDLPVYSDCRLQLLAWAEVYPPDIDEAWNLVETLLDMSAPSFRPLIANRLPLVVAGVIVRAATDAAAAIDSTVLADSARSILRSAQARGLANGGEVMAYAAVLDRLGDRDQAIATVRSYLNEHPEHASLFARARELRPLRADPAFIELIGERPIAGPPD